jgi:serine phosphatase RsbU (regulator of sigma subunit)
LQVNAMSSLRAKLFFSMSFLVVVTIVGNSLQYIKIFLDHQKGQVEDTIQLLAERAQSQVKHIVNNWKSQISVAIPSLSSASEAGRKLSFKNFINSNSEFVALQIWRGKSAASLDLILSGDVFTNRLTDVRFEDKVPSLIKKKSIDSSYTWLQNSIPSLADKQFAISSLGRDTGLPLLRLVLRFAVANTDSVVWAVLVTWQTEIISALPKSGFIESQIVDESGVVFSGHSLHQMIRGSKAARSRLVRHALSGKLLSGFVGEYNGADRRKKLGAFSRMPEFSMTVLVEQDAEAAYSTLKKNLISTALWASLFLLFAVAISYVVAQGITGGLRAVTVATERIAAGDFSFRIQPSSRDEVALLALSVNSMSEKIVQLMSSEVENARFEKELETAKMVQSTFFPKSDIVSGPLSVSGFYQPASECGGDLWGQIEIKSGVQIVFIADATGHGAPAALVTAMAYSTCMTLADMVQTSQLITSSPGEMLRRLNKIIYEAVNGKICMTFFVALIDTEIGKVTYANAGHNFPVLLAQDEYDDRVKRRQKALRRISKIPAITMSLKGTPLGLDPHSKFKETSMPIRAGDRFFFFTDGLIECSSPEGNVWGRKFLLEQLVETAVMPMDEMKQEILNRAFSFFSSKPIDDDVTVVLAEIDKDWKVGEPWVPREGSGMEFSGSMLGVAGESGTLPPADSSLDHREDETEFMMLENQIGAALAEGANSLSSDIPMPADDFGVIVGTIPTLSPGGVEQENLHRDALRDKRSHSSEDQNTVIARLQSEVFAEYELVNREFSESLESTITKGAGNRIKLPDAG